MSESTIPFVKYSSCGNNFVIVDEVSEFRIAESNKPLFAYQASDMCFGVGSDGLLAIQTFRPDVLKKINDNFGYWQSLPAIDGCDFIFRLFESNGKEALSCGNGLLCIAAYLNREYGIMATQIMTGAPLVRPSVVTVGVHQETLLSWCNMGHPQLPPASVVSPSAIDEIGDIDARLGLIRGLEIGFRSHDLQPFTNANSLSLSGYVIFTGEPHLVIFPDELLPAGLADTLFASPPESGSREKRWNFGSWLVNHIGAYINKHYRNHFFAGVNVNFARVDPVAGTIQHRCYERGVDYETLACGTGAVAVSYVTKKLQQLNISKVTLTPHRCSWYRPNARLWVEESTEGWLLEGYPLRLFSGQFLVRESTAACSSGGASQIGPHRQEGMPAMQSTHDAAKSTSDTKSMVEDLS